MKINTFLLTFFLIAYSLSAKTFSNITTDPVMPMLPDIVLCDTDSNTQNGSTTFNITIQTPIILASQTLPASNYTVSYYSSQATANGNVSQIINPTNYSSVSNTTIWVRVENSTTNQYAIGSFILIVNTPISLTTPTIYDVCDDDANPNDTFATFDLTSFVGAITNHTISFYLDAAHSLPVNTPNAFVNIASVQTIFWTATNTITGCVSNRTLTLRVLPIPTPHTNPLAISVCDANNDGIEMIDLTQNAIYILNGQTGVSLRYFNTQYDLFNNINEILAPVQAYVTGNVWIKVESNSFLNSNGNYCYTIVEQPIQIHPSPPISGIGYSIVNNSGIQTLTVETTGSGNYGYVLDGGASQISPIFQNVSVGNHTITITDLMYGCTTTINGINVNLTATSPPTTVNNLQTFGPGATLASIQVTGQNIKWYSGLNKNLTSTPLPLSTVLVDGTTYYASQTIGGYESITRIPITVHLVLSTDQFELKGLTYAPNPVATDLSIKSDDVIDSISIYNLLGQLVSSKKCNSMTLLLDVTSLNSGNYFVKLTSENKQSTIKIEKE
jgi:hypothetical protein